MDIYLKSIFDKLNDEYFDSKATLKDIRWMNKESKDVFGRADYISKVLEFNTVLRSEPDVLRFVVYHEMCHLVTINRKDQKVHHHKEFHALSNRYKHFKREEHKFALFVKKFWLKTGHITEQELKKVR